MFVPDRLKANSYRVLRISANATFSEIHRAATSMRRAAMLGVTDMTEVDRPQLGEVPRTESDVRTAIGRLGNPGQRLSDRLFWFNLPQDPQTGDTGTPSAPPPLPAEPNGAPWRHDAALRSLVAVLGAGLDDAGVILWVKALQSWHEIVSDDEYWGFSLGLEERGGFEPAALPSEIDSLRDDAVRLAAEPLLVAARDSLVRNDISTVGRILIAFEALRSTGSWTVAAQEDISAPAVARFRALCRAVRDESGSKIVREQDAAKSNKAICDAALKRFRGEIEPALAGLVKIFTPDQEAAQEVREESALCLSGIAADYTWANEFIVSEKLNEEALSLAHNTLGAIRIEDNLAQIRVSARTQRVRGTSISSAPPLSTINGFGFTMYGNSDYDAETQSYSTTHYFVALFVPIFPLARYRVINAGGNQYRFLGKLPLRKVDRWHLGISATVIVMLILSGVMSSSQSSGSPSSSSNSPGYSTQSGSKKSRLAELKTRIESGRTRMAELKTQLQPVIDEMTNLNTQIESLAAELKSLDAQNTGGVQIDVDNYNAKVNEHNALLTRRKALFAANSADIQTYDDLVKQDAALVDQHNALLK